MELRKLQATDLFSMVKIINGVGVKKIIDAIDVKGITEAKKKIKADGSNKNAIYREVGLNAFMSAGNVILENIPLIEYDLYQFVGSVANMKKEEVATMDMGEFMDLLIEIVNKEEFKDFFKRALRFAKSV